MHVYKLSCIAEIEYLFHDYIINNPYYKDLYRININLYHKD